MAEVESKIYELGYHLTPDLEEADAKTHAQELSDLITRDGGFVMFSREPRRVHLSYPVHKKSYGYFGVFDFTAPPEAIDKINTRLKLQNGVLRFLLIKKPHGGSDLRILGERRERARARAQEPSALREKIKAPPERTEEAGKEIRTEELEKEIEEVIKGL